RGIYWPVLALVVSLVHTYMTAMVIGLWLSDLVRRVWFEGRLRSELPQIVAVPALLVLSFWQTGFFTVGAGVTKAGFGHYRMNLLSLIDPSGWSYVLRDIPGSQGEEEGFNYMGLGVILLSLAVLPAAKAALPALRARRHYWPLLALLVG